MEGEKLEVQSKQVGRRQSAGRPKGRFKELAQLVGGLVRMNFISEHRNFSAGFLRDVVRHGRTRYAILSATSYGR